MERIADLPALKNLSKIPFVAPDQPVSDAIEMMSQKNLGALLILKHGQVVGIFSERDYARKLLLQGRSSLLTPIQDVMVKDVLFVTPEFTLEEALALMTSKKIRHLPVLDKSLNVLALLTIDEIVEGLISKKEFIIHELTRYISGESAPTVGSEFLQIKKKVRGLYLSESTKVSA